MRNVADIKREDNLNYILPVNYSLGDEALCRNEYGRTIIVAHLHYYDTLDYYLDYIKNVPEEIRVIFTTSSHDVAVAIEERFSNWRRNYQVIIKANRGRDISAFLVTCQEEILKYRYFGFLHDKKEKHDVFKVDTDSFVRCLWENTIGSTLYIQNVLKVLSTGHTLGLLVPPRPFMPHFVATYTDMWKSNFGMVQKLAKKLGLRCDLDAQKPLITIGTMFWAKVDALRKLLEAGWKYEDFDAEPLNDDGTLSHAIERALAYVAQDAGYDTGWIMTDRFAGERLECMQETLQSALFCINRYIGIANIGSLECFDHIQQELNRFCDQHKNIYIYGAGEYGKACLRSLKFQHKKVTAFLVTKMGETLEIDGVPVHQISKKYLTEETGIIVAVTYDKQSAVLETIRAHNETFSNLFHYDGVWAREK